MRRNVGLVVPAAATVGNGQPSRGGSHIGRAQGHGAGVLVGGQVQHGRPVAGGVCPGIAARLGAGSVGNRPAVAVGLLVFAVAVGNIQVVMIGAAGVGRGHDDEVGGVVLQVAAAAGAGEGVESGVRGGAGQRLQGRGGRVRAVGRVRRVQAHDDVAGRAGLRVESGGYAGQGVAAQTVAGGEGDGAAFRGGFVTDRAISVVAFRQVAHAEV